MMVIVMYDISEDAPRNNLIKRLRYYGLRRIQKSVFADCWKLKRDLNLQVSLTFTYLQTKTV